MNDEGLKRILKKYWWSSITDSELKEINPKNRNIETQMKNSPVGEEMQHFKEEVMITVYPLIYLVPTGLINKGSECEINF